MRRKTRKRIGTTMRMTGMTTTKRKKMKKMTIGIDSSS